MNTKPENAPTPKIPERPFQGRVAQEIEARLAAAFAPVTLAVQDDSESHRGHAGWRDGGETHFSVVIRAAELGAMSRLARHRAVHAAIGPDLVAAIHALVLDIDGA